MHEGEHEEQDRPGERLVPTIGIDAVESCGRDDRHFTQAQWALGH